MPRALPGTRFAEAQAPRKFWIRFSVGHTVFFDYAKEGHLWGTPGEYFENFIRGWEILGQENPVEYAVQEEQPDENTIWKRAVGPYPYPPRNLKEQRYG